MPEHTARPRTVRVLVYLGTGGTIAVGCIRSIWAGPNRSDTRLGSAIRLEEVPPCPHGVDSDMWIAYHGLGRLIDRQWQQANGVDAR